MFSCFVWFCKYENCCFLVSGMLIDVVMMVLGVVEDGLKLDLILLGVNCGVNIVEDVIYLGMVFVVMEGMLVGYCLIVLSQVYVCEGMGDIVLFVIVEVWGECVLCLLIVVDMLLCMLININFLVLDFDVVCGVKVVEQGFYDYGCVKIVKGVDL